MAFEAYTPGLAQAIDQVLRGLQGMGPELALVGLFLVLVLLDLAMPAKHFPNLLPLLTLLGLLGILGWQAYALGHAGQYVSPGPFFHGLLFRDRLALYAAPLFSLAAVLTVLLSLRHRPLQTGFQGKGEYYGFLVVLVLGLNLMVQAVNLLMVFTAVELVSIASYLLTISLRDRPRSVEAALKYLLYGGFSAGVMVYGMSFLYGFTGSLNFTSGQFALGLAAIHPLALGLAVMFTLAGFLFKISAAPFHFWTPDAYDGAPTPIAAFFATGPKIAGVLLFYRFLHIFEAEVFAARQEQLQIFVGGIALLSLAIGNFTAIWQKRAKRLLAYSSVSHAGFLLIALSVIAHGALPAILFYLTVLLFMNFGIFLVVQVAEDSLGSTKLADYSGLGKQSPFLGVMALIFLISLTGLPPTAGFMGKLFVFTTLWQGYQATGLPIMLLLMIAGLLLTGVAFFYYVRLPYFMFFKRNLKSIDLVLSLGDKLLLLGLAVPVLLFFFRADWLLDLISQTLLDLK